MVSVNRVILRFIIPFTIVAYIIFILWEHTLYDDANRSQIAQTHINNIHSGTPINGLILGGSNAVYSLSAERLGKSMGGAWYNTALINEGFSDRNYEVFINDIANLIDVAGISTVIYSTMQPYRLGEIKKREAIAVDISGHPYLQIKPTRRVLFYLNSLMKHVTTPHFTYPLPNKFGDFEFNQFNCIFLIENATRERDAVAVIVPFLIERTLFFAAKFPNAKIMITLPSEIYGTNTPLDNGFDEILRNQFNETLRRLPPSTSERVFLILQPPFPSVGYVCDGQNHANQNGRNWRTDDLSRNLMNLK